MFTQNMEQGAKSKLKAENVTFLARLVPCGAKTRSGTPCQNKPTLISIRCRFHGGAGSGAPLGNQNALKTGYYSRESIDARRRLAALKREVAAGNRSSQELSELEREIEALANRHRTERLKKDAAKAARQLAALRREEPTDNHPDKVLEERPPKIDPDLAALKRANAAFDNSWIDEVLEDIRRERAEQASQELALKQGERLRKDTAKAVQQVAALRREEPIGNYADEVPEEHAPKIDAELAALKRAASAFDNSWIDEVLEDIRRERAEQASQELALKQGQMLRKDAAKAARQLAALGREEPSGDYADEALEERAPKIDPELDETSTDRAREVNREHAARKRATAGSCNNEIDVSWM